MNPLLVLFDVEGPVGIEVPAQIDGSELDESLGDGPGPAHSRTFHPVLDQVLAGAFDRTAGDRPALGEVLVITHSSAIAVQVAGDPQQGLAPGSGDLAF